MTLLVRRCWIALALIASSLGQTFAAESEATPNFRRDVLPILNSYCVRCHGPKMQEARIRLDDLSTDFLNDRVAAEVWHEVRNALNAGEMPPEDEKQPTPQQREAITQWISGEIDKAVDTQRNTSGRVVLRRLNRVEYQNTMTDLLDLEMDYVRDLPPDSFSADGFKNDGCSLQMSAVQLEYYLEAARRALDRVIVSGPKPRVYDYVFTESYNGNWLGKSEKSNTLGRQQEFLGKMTKDYPEAGDFLVRVKLTAKLKPDTGFPLLEVGVGYRPDTKILFREFPLVEITSDQEQTFEFRGRLEVFPLPVRGQGKYPGLVVRMRNRYDDGSPLPKGQKGEKKRGMIYPREDKIPELIIQSVEFHGPVFNQWPPARHRRILFDSPLKESNEKEYVAEVLDRFMQRAYRRPVKRVEVDRIVEYYESIRPEFPSFEESIRETLAMVLIRPDFLYLFEQPGDKKREINDWELASRLSYFLWSTMPDDKLNVLAAQGKLRDANVLDEQVTRMLRDPRSSRFIDQFTEQWLHLNAVDSVAVSRDFHPKFDDRLKADMRGETHAFFAELLRQNMSALNMLDSDFTMLNEPLAEHYGIENVYGREFRRVNLKPDQHRGGLLGHASILLSNSTGSDSHAVRRAVWIRDRLLDDPPASPPPDVPTLDEATPNFLKLPIREQLEIHRGTESCASCHKNIDPWGVALENFDAVGLWRDEIRRKNGRKFENVPVDAKDALPGGIELDGVDSLKLHLVTERKTQFARSLVARLLTYAVGRRMELSDQPTIDDLTEKFATNDYRLRDLVLSVVASTPFQTK